MPNATEFASLVTEIPWMEAETLPDLLKAINDRLRDIREDFGRLTVGVGGGGSTTTIINNTITPGAGSPVQVIPVSLGAAPASVGIPAVAVGTLVVYRCLQDALGNGTVLWDPAFNNPGQPGKTANTYSTIWFERTGESEMKQMSNWMWNKAV